MCALLWLGTATRESDVMVPAALYSEPGSGMMDGGRREEGENEMCGEEEAADREEESTETV